MAEPTLSDVHAELKLLGQREESHHEQVSTVLAELRTEQRAQGRLLRGNGEPGLVTEVGWLKRFATDRRKIELLIIAAVLIAMITAVLGFKD